MKIVVHVGLGIVRICPAIKQKGVLSILPKIEFFSNLSKKVFLNMKTDGCPYSSWDDQNGTVVVTPLSF